MSIKENIKKELLERIKEEVNKMYTVISNLEYHDFLYSDNFTKGQIQGLRNGVISLDKIKSFVESI